MNIVDKSWVKRVISYSLDPALAIDFKTAYLSWTFLVVRKLKFLAVKIAIIYPPETTWKRCL